MSFSPFRAARCLIGLIGAALLCTLALATPAMPAADRPYTTGNLSDFADIASLCGSKPIRIAVSVGSYTAHRQIARAELVDEAKKCPNIQEVGFTDAGGNPEKELANIRSLAAQGYDIILVVPDAGAATIPAMRDAMRAGAVVVPMETGPSFMGRRGIDYTTLATIDPVQQGRMHAEFLVEALGGKGNIVVWGGVPGAFQTAQQEIGWRAVFARYPEIKVLEGPVISNWDPAKYQEVASALLAKYPQIDAMYSDYANGVLGALRAFKAAGRPMVPVTGHDANGAECFFLQNRQDNPAYQIGLNDSFTWMYRIGLRHALGALNGIEHVGPNIVNLERVVDSTSNDPALAPACIAGLPSEASLKSTMLTPEALAAVFK